MRLWLHLTGQHPKEKGKHLFHAAINNSMIHNSIVDPFFLRRGRNVERLNSSKASRLSLKLDRSPSWDQAMVFKGTKVAHNSRAPATVHSTS